MAVRWGVSVMTRTSNNASHLWLHSGHEVLYEEHIEMVAKWQIVVLFLCHSGYLKAEKTQVSALYIKQLMRT